MKNMKHLLTLLSAVSLALSLCACRAEAPAAPTEAHSATELPETSAPATESTTESTEATEAVPQHRNPLTGEVLSAPLDRRIVSISIGNTADAMPTHGLPQADIVFEMYVNHLTTRFLALYTDPAAVSAVGSVRSHRYPFTDLSLAYDTIAAHAGGSGKVIQDANRSGIDHMNIDTSSSTPYSFRDKTRKANGYPWEHCLFASGAGLYDYAASKDFRTAMDPKKNYGLTFAEGAALTEGQSANTVTLTFRLSSSSKKSVMTYNAATGRYEFTQHSSPMLDGNTGEAVAFRNVFVLLADTQTDADGYHLSDLLGTGEGFFACDGYLVPILWHRDRDTDPFTFTLADGTPLAQGVGSSYIAIAPLDSTVEAQ